MKFRTLCKKQSSLEVCAHNSGRYKKPVFICVSGKTQSDMTYVLRSLFGVSRHSHATEISSSPLQL